MSFDISITNSPDTESLKLCCPRFESLVADLLERTRQPCKDCMKDAGVSSGEISEVLLVGGQTRMPKVIFMSVCVWAGGHIQHLLVLHQLTL